MMLEPNEQATRVFGFAGTIVPLYARWGLPGPVTCLAMIQTHPIGTEICHG